MSTDHFPDDTKKVAAEVTRLGSGGSLSAERDAVLRQLDDRTNQTWAGKRARWAKLVRAQDAEITRAWAARDAAVADLEAHAEAEVRRAVAAERERCAKKAAPEHIPFSDDEWRVRCEVRDSILGA